MLNLKNVCVFNLQTAGDHVGGADLLLPQTDTPDQLRSYSPRAIQVTDTFLQRFGSLGCEDQMRLLRKLLSHHCSTHHELQVPDDFLPLSIDAMKNLQSHGKVNVLYSLARGLGLMRPDYSDSCFPVTRMPFGMLEYMVSFFNSNPGANVRLLSLC